MTELLYLTDAKICGSTGFSVRTPREAARAVLLDRDGRMALLFVSKYGFYSLPGGGVERGESKLDALRREMREETGCVIEDNPIELGCVYENRYRFNCTQRSYYYLAHVKGRKGTPKPTPSEQRDGTRVCWTPPRKALELLTNGISDGYRVEFIKARDMAAILASGVLMDASAGKNI